MTTEPPILPDDTMAAELALGVLDGDERAAALRRMLVEPDFAREVERWRAHFALMFDGVAEIAPPEGLFNRIDAKTRGSPRPAANLWKPTAIAASLAALLMTAVALRPVERPLPAPPPVATRPMVAAMALADASGAQPAMYDAATGMVKMPGPMPIPAGKSAQLWVIEGKAAPKPLGTFRASGPGIYEAEARMETGIPAGAMLAISIEPMGGSPTGQPTGPVIASGMLSKV